MGQVIPWKGADWMTLLRIRDYIKHPASDYHLRCFYDIYLKSKGQYVADSY